MSRKIIQPTVSEEILKFPDPVHGPKTEREVCTAAAKQAFFQMFGKQLSDHLAERLADATITTRIREQ